MSDATIRCPSCNQQIALTEAVLSPIMAPLQERAAAEARKRELALAQRERALAEKAAELERARLSQDEQLAARLRQERERIGQDEARRATEAVGAKLRDLQTQVTEKDKKLAAAEEAELALRRQQRELEDKQRKLQLEVERRLAEEGRKIREAAQIEMAEEHRLKEAETQQQLAAMRKQIDDLKRKAEQASQQTQGEVLELELEAALARQFPRDRIEPVPKGAFGGDVLQRVHDDAGQYCGTILWESKRTKTWSDGWLVKLRDDQRAAKADLAALVSAAMPRDIATLACIDNVWIAGIPCALGLAAALRAGLIERQRIAQSLQGRQSKMDVLYEYLAGPHFKQRVEAVVESFTAMREDLEAEKRAIQRAWAKREKQIDRVLLNTVGMHGDIAGIMGAALPEIPMAELKALAADNGLETTLSTGAGRTE